MLLKRKDATDSGSPKEATAGGSSPSILHLCPDSRCIFAVVEERGRENVYRIEIPSFRRSIVVSGGGVNTTVTAAPDGRSIAYLHQSNTEPAEVWFSGRRVSHHTDSITAALDLHPLESFGFIGALGDSVYGWVLKPPGFNAAKRYPLVYLIHGGPQGAWDDNWHPRWNYQMFASRGYVVAAVNFHGSTGSASVHRRYFEHWGDYPYEYYEGSMCWPASILY